MRRAIKLTCPGYECIKFRWASAAAQRASDMNDYAPPSRIFRQQRLFNPI